MLIEWGTPMEVNDIAVQAGLIVAENDNIHRFALTPAEQKFAELIISACINECRQSVYVSMEIELDRHSETREFDRGSKSGRKFGAMDCMRRLVKRFGIKQ